MNPKKLFPLVITGDLNATKKFYLEVAGFAPTVDRDGYLQVQYGGADGPELCFMAPESAPAMGPLKRFNGDGLIISIPTASADDAYKALKKRGAKVAGEPSDKPWGWRSFIAVDPNGVLLDFFHVRPDTAAHAPS